MDVYVLSVELMIPDTKSSLCDIYNPGITFEWNGVKEKSECRVGFAPLPLPEVRVP